MNCNDGGGEIHQASEIQGAGKEITVEVGNSDDERLAEMGYKAELKREFGLISCIAFGFSVSHYLPIYPTYPTVALIYPTCNIIFPICISMLSRFFCFGEHISLLAYN